MKDAEDYKDVEMTEANNSLHKKSNYTKQALTNAKVMELKKKNSTAQKQIQWAFDSDDKLND
eukprot:14400259-Ditylum_brightwellii.AAC.1